MGRQSMDTPRARRMREVVEEFECSGQTAAVFAREHGMPVTTLTWWQHVWRGGIEPSSANQSRAISQQADEFREIRVGWPAPPAERLKVVLTSGDVVRVPDGADRETLLIVLDALKTAC